MDFKISIGDNAGALVSGVSKFVFDIKAITGPGAASGVVEGVEVLSAGLADLAACFKPSDAALAEIKAKPFSFGVALAVGVVGALGL